MRVGQHGVLCLAIATLNVFAVADASAGDANSAGGFNADVQHIDKSGGSLDRAVGTGLEPSSSGSASDAAADLEATRAAIDQRTKPSVSLSVSGWVGGEVRTTK
jgi:hypothetical protein